MAEDEIENKDFVEAYRFFNEIPGEELRCRLWFPPHVDSRIERQRKGHPDAAPRQRLANRDLPGLPAQ